MVPEQDAHDLDGQGQPESFKTDRIEFVIVERETDPEDTGASSKSDRDYEWEIPDRSTFDAVIGEAIDKFTEDDWDRIDYVTFSSVGWNTGVGLFAFGSDKLVQMTMFRDIIRSITRGNKRFESYPKRMLLNRYALTIYFNAAFAFSNAPKLLFFFKKLNGFQGDLTIAETRFYPDDHPTRKGCKIVACEADQRFLDELYKYPKDHPFSIRYGGNLYVRGGERIDPDDPNAVRPSRPRLTRNAAKKFIHGAGEDILNAGQKADDEAARKAREEHAKKFVGFTVLFARKHLFVGVFNDKKGRLYSLPGSYPCLRWKKHCNPTYDIRRASKPNFKDFYVGYEPGGRPAVRQAVHMNGMIKESEGRKIEVALIKTNEIICMIMPMPVMKYEICYICKSNFENIMIIVELTDNESLITIKGRSRRINSKTRYYGNKRVYTIRIYTVSSHFCFTITVKKCSKYLIMVILTRDVYAVITVISVPRINLGKAWFTLIKRADEKTVCKLSECNRKEPNYDDILDLIILMILLRYTYLYVDWLYQSLTRSVSREYEKVKMRNVSTRSKCKRRRGLLGKQREIINVAETWNTKRLKVGRGKLTMHGDNECIKQGNYIILFRQAEKYVSLQIQGGISILEIGKPKIVLTEANMESRRSLKIIGVVSKLKDDKQVMCKHRYGTPVTDMESRRSLKINDGVYKKLVIKQAKHNQRCKGVKKIIPNERRSSTKLNILQV